MIVAKKLLHSDPSMWCEAVTAWNDPLVSRVVRETIFLSHNPNVITWFFNYQGVSFSFYAIQLMQDSLPHQGHYHNTFDPFYVARKS